jgi:hypothetical protein
LALNVEALKVERDRLKEGLRELEAEQRKAESELKNLRQREIAAKREIEALATLIEIQESRDPNKKKPEKPEKKEE